MSFLLLIPVFFPIAMGLALLALNFKERKPRQIYVASTVIANMVMAIVFMLTVPRTTFTLVRFTDTLSISLKLDGLSILFGFIVSTLWVVATFYSFEYMKHEGKENRFFSFFTMSFGVVCGIAFSANLITMYLFYELLTVATLPLVMHAMDKRASSAGRKYVAFSITGASFGFISIMLLMNFGVTLDFTYGGVLTDMALLAGHEPLVQIGYVCAFFGFGVKAAVFPFYNWLPSAGVAPTPVSALLHAVAVVNAGIFAITRVIYFCFGTGFLEGTWAQYLTMLMAIVTIVFGSSMALRENHIKRRLAFSTVSNLSYMLFSLTIMTPEGMVGGLAHMLFHSVLKITLFFVAGAIIYKTGREYVDQLEGFGRYMPKTMIAFTICSMGLIGIPPLMGITSKWLISKAAVECQLPLAIAGIVALIVSALLTTLYLFEIIIKAYFPNRSKEELAEFNKDVHDPNGYMTIPMLGLTAFSVFFGIWPDPFIKIFEMISMGLF